MSAIGIRTDEIDRMSDRAEEYGFLYPLIKWGIKKEDVKTFWSKQAFDLDLPEHFGNCVTCWKKSDRKFLTIAKENPSAFDFMDRMEKTYPHAGAGEGPRKFFRKYRSVEDMLALSKIPFKPFVPGAFQMEMFDPELDMQSACGESCEVGADEIGVYANEGKPI